MLSHHEIATLVLLKDAERTCEEIDGDFLVLRRYRLVEWSPRGGGDARLRLTPLGRELLGRLGVDEEAMH